MSRQKSVCRKSVRRKNVRRKNVPVPTADQLLEVNMTKAFKIFLFLILSDHNITITQKGTSH